MTDANAFWWREGLNFSCVRCGACCGRDPGTVRFTPEELSAMSRFLGVSEEKFRQDYTWRKYGALSLRERRNYDCVFLRMSGGEAKCGVYSARPRQCVSFPFWPETLENRDAWEQYSDSCPGMNAGKFFSYEEISVIVVEYIHEGLLKFL